MRACYARTPTRFVKCSLLLRQFRTYKLQLLRIPWSVIDRFFLVLVVFVAPTLCRQVPAPVGHVPGASGVRGTSQ